MLQSLTIDEQAGTITIVVDLDPAKPSASGKTMVVGSTRGNAVSDAEIDGCPITVGVNCYYKR